MDLAKRDKILEQLKNELKNIRVDVRKISKHMGGNTIALKKVENVESFSKKGGSEKIAINKLLQYLENSSRASLNPYVKMRIEVEMKRINNLMDI
jgi:hypothetical protein